MNHPENKLIRNINCEHMQLQTILLHYCTNTNNTNTTTNNSNNNNNTNNNNTNNNYITNNNNNNSNTNNNTTTTTTTNNNNNINNNNNSMIECIGLHCLLSIGFKINTHAILNVLNNYIQTPMLLCDDHTVIDGGTSTARWHLDIKNSNVVLDLDYIQHYVHTYPYAVTNTNTVSIGCGAYQLIYAEEPDPELYLNEWDAWYSNINAQLACIQNYK